MVIGPWGRLHGLLKWVIRYVASHSQFETHLYWASYGDPLRGRELGVLRVREHPLSAQVHPLTAKSTLSKLKKIFVKYLVILRSNKNMVI